MSKPDLAPLFRRRTYSHSRLHLKVGHRALGRRARSPLPVSRTCMFTPLEDVSMKHCRVSAFVRVARVIAYAAVALGLGAGSLLAQATGKVEGRVRDQAGAPIANAQVFVVGTAFNALTNPQGYYFINNIPAGTVAVRSNFIGYKSTQVEGVKVLAGQTITVDVQLEQTAVQIQEITVVTETQPLVPRDEVTTKQRIDGQFADQLPVDRINDVLQLQPGVTANNNGAFLFSGGRPTETATYVTASRCSRATTPTCSSRT